MFLSQRGLLVAVVLIFSTTSCSLFFFAGYLFPADRFEDLHSTELDQFQSYAQPVDRDRILSAVGSSASGGISISRMSFSPLGGAHAPQWPLFWVLTIPQNEDGRCKEIMLSWGKQVPGDSLVFIGAQTNRTTTSGHRFIALDAAPEKKALKEILAWRLVAEMYPEREWFVKGDDDTWFLVHNLNRYLEEFDPRLPYFLGCKFHLGGPGGIQYVSGGAGYVLSRQAAGRMKNVTTRCITDYGNLSEGDLAISKCLQIVGVFPEDTRDERGRQRFHVFPYDYHANWYRYGFHSNKFWYHDWVWGPVIEGRGCCGDNTTVSFHYMSKKMQNFQFPLPPGRSGSQLKLDPKALQQRSTLAPRQQSRKRLRFSFASPSSSPV